MAAYLAKAGIQCGIFERELFPRPHVGESLVPSSTRVFRDLDFLPVMESNGFVHKFGAAWTAAERPRVFETANWHDLAAEEQVSLRFEERDQAGVAQPYTYHVDRGLFDLLLLQHAEKLGAKVYSGVSVRGVDLSEPDHAGLVFAMGNKDFRIRARMVVDASGRRTVVGNQMKWRIKDPTFDQYAIHTWFDGYDRGALADSQEQGEYIFIHFLPVTNTWIWQIPITETVTSIGVVTQKKNFANQRESRERFFWDCVSTRPDLLSSLRAAEQVRPFKDEGDYSYAMKQITGDRLMLIGDAARFVDPIFSTGVSIALNCSRFGSRDIVGAMESGDFRRDSFETYESTIKRGTRNWYNFISVYYRLNVLFTAFINDKRYRLDVLKLLQGDVYDDDEPEVLTRMREIVTEVERNPRHVWHDALGDLTANVFVTATQS